jgi:hypothetical protein
MHPDEQNASGCPLHNQTGIVAIHDFDAILAGLSPELRAAFEQERAARQVEIDGIIATNGYQT